MKTSHSNKLALGIATLATLSCLCMNAAYAHISEKEGYMLDTRGNVVRNSYNECWRTGYWIPAMAIAECDPNLVKKEEPKVAAPVPVPAPVVVPAPEPVVAPAPVVAPTPEPVVAPVPVAVPAPAPAPVPVQAAPVVVPPPPPAPVVVAPPARTKLTLSADSLFDFDKATIKPEGKRNLDKFAEDLKGVEYKVITVTGHADRIGSPRYNMKLSVRRAEAVKAYLVKHGGIESSKISTIGKGETEPVTKPGECRGQKVTKELIDCKAPDRRVEVEVSGIK